MDAKVATDTDLAKGCQKTVQKPDKLSFTAHVDNIPNAEASTKSSTTSHDPTETPSTDGIPCPVCNLGHELEVCKFL